jgi:hypothetical protein
MVLMGCALIAPEIIIFWALRQHRAARYLAKRHKEQGWTMTHGFFLVMGGFTLHDKGTALRILDYWELETLSKAGKITWPSITKEEIQDRSKGDYLSKGIVVMQIGWFITQFIGRCVYSLEITELEKFTFIITILTVATYGLWWHKPLDVHCSVPVHLLETKNKNVVSEGILSGSPVANPLSGPYPGTSCEPVEGIESTQDIASQFPIIEESQPLQQPLIVSELDPDPSPHRPNSSNAIAPPAAHDTQFLITEESQLLQQWALIVSKLDPDPSPQEPNPSNAITLPSHNTQFLITEESRLLQQPLIVSELDPDPSSQGPNPSNAIALPSHKTQFLITEESQLLQQPLIVSELNPNPSPQGPIPSNTKIHGTLGFQVIFLRTFIDTISPHELDHSMPLCVPTFYSPDLTDVKQADTLYIFVLVLMAMLIVTMLAVLSGPIDSQSTPESDAWTTLAFVDVFNVGWLSYMVAAASLPVVKVRLPSPTDTSPLKIILSWFFGAVLPVTLAALLVFTRIPFFILATIQLRALTPEQLAEIKWVSILPHIKSG